MSEKELKERIKVYLSKNGITVNEICREMKYSQSTMNSQVSGEVQLSCKTLLAIIGYCKDMSTEWLFRDKGSMLLSDDCKKVINIERVGGSGDGQTNTVGDNNSVETNELVQRLMDNMEKKDAMIKDLMAKMVEIMMSK